MYCILTYNQLSAKGLSRFSENYQVGNDVPNPDGILLRSHKLHGLALPASVKAVARAGAGVNNIPVDDYTENGIVVFNTPGANANAVKELVLAAMLLGSRDIIGGLDYAQSLHSITDKIQMNSLLEQQKKQFVGHELSHKKLGIIGLGAIGTLVANMALELGMQVLGYDPAISVEAAWKLSSRVKRMESLSSLMSQSDFISVHVPAIEATAGLINKENLSYCREHTVLLNFAREEVVNQEDVLSALQKGTLGRYISDFPTPQLLGHKQVLLMPHIGASTKEAEENCAVMAAEQMIEFLEKGNIRNSVNFPATSMDNNGHRITFSNENVPKVLGNVLTLLAEDGLNVMDMVNKSRDKIAYNIIDLDQPPKASLLANIAKVQGIINVRQIGS